jgi:hypothetical protein
MLVMTALNLALTPIPASPILALLTPIPTPIPLLVM